MAIRGVSGLLAVSVLVVLSSCSAASTPSGPEPSPGPDRVASAPAVLVVAGDIGECGFGSESTARLLDRLPGIVLAAGDLAYPHGSAVNFKNCYDPSWGRHRDRTRPVPGNHEYETPNAGPYFEYFGGNAGPPGRGYYSYLAGAWQIIALNSEVDARASSAQVQWLRGELSSRPGDCTLAYFHRPLFTSGPNRPNADMRALWRTLYEFNVDVIVSGHDHLYERFAPQDPDGRADSGRGIRQFIVGTGGARLYPVARIAPNSERQASVFGVLMLTLTSAAYQWEFISAGSTPFRDTGIGSCH
jgi:hypothetical protein